MSSIHHVAELHDKMGHGKARLPKPGFLPEKFMQMRLNFMLEELLETAKACGFNLEMYDRTSLDTQPIFMKDANNYKRHDHDLEDALDGLIDLQYVLLGTADLMGFANPGPGKFASSSIWHEGWSRVHKANMLKEPVVNAKESSRGFNIDLKKPKGWLKPQFKDLLV